jgi:hypothetical protein
MDKYASSFAEAFVVKCFEAGLSEKAASDLLQSQIVVATDAECPGFAQGYTKVAAQFPGLLIPLPTPAMFEKRSNTGKLLMGLGGLLGLGAAATGVKKVYDLTDPNRLGDQLPSPDTYTPELAKAKQQETNTYKDTLHDLNNRGADESNRLRELDAVVAERAPGASAAYAESQRLRKDKNSATFKRQAYLDRLDKSTEANSKALNRMEERSQARQDRSEAWYTAPYRFVNKLRGRDPYDESRIRDLRAQEEMISRLKRDKELRSTIVNNYGSRIPERVANKRVSTFEIGQ